MKRHIEEMTHEEIIALTDDEITILEDILCAEQGLVSVDKPTQPELPPNRNGEIVYQVGGFIFSKYEAAAAVYGEIRKWDQYLVSEKRDWQLDIYSVCPYNSYERDGLEIQTKSVLPSPYFDSEVAIKTEYKKKKNEYDKDMCLYKAWRELRGEIESHILSVSDGEKFIEMEFNKHVKEYGRFLSLALACEDNLQKVVIIAKTFFEKSYPMLSDEYRDRIVAAAENIGNEVI